MKIHNANDIMTAKDFDLAEPWWLSLFVIMPTHYFVKYGNMRYDRNKLKKHMSANIKNLSLNNPNDTIVHP